MTMLCFKDIKNVIDDIAKENDFVQYQINVKEEQFTGDYYFSDIVRVQIVDESEKRVNINLLIKFLKMTDETRDKKQTGGSKVKFSEFEYSAYTFMFPILQKFQQEHNIPAEKCFSFPKFFKGSVEDKKEYLILEDASYDGFVKYEKTKSFDYYHAKVIFTKLAQFHSLSFAMAEKDPTTFKQLVENLFIDINFSEFLEDITVNALKRVTPQLKNLEKANVIMEFIKDCRVIFKESQDHKVTAPYNVICHGDCHVNNLLFKGSGSNLDLLIVDWQMCKYASPMTDIMEVFFMSTDKPFRDKYYKQLCDDYYNALGDNLQLYGCDVNKLYPRQAFEDNLIDLLPQGLIFGAMGSTSLLEDANQHIELDKMLDGDSDHKITATDEMIKRLEGYAEDMMVCNEIMKSRRKLF